MNIGIDNALGIHPAALSLRVARAGVLANNIAQADTPGYKARDIDFNAALKRAIETPVVRGPHAHSGDAGTLRRTSSAHLPQGADSSALVSQRDLLYRTQTMPAVDGNSVDVQVEQAAFARNNMQLQASLRFVNGKLNGLLSAIKGE